MSFEANAKFWEIERNLSKFDACDDKEIFIGYSTNSHAFRMFNKRTRVVTESVSVMVKDVEQSKTDPTISIDTEDEDTIEINAPHCDSHTPSNGSTTIGDVDEIDPKIVIKPKKPESKVLKIHPTNAIIRDITKEERPEVKRMLITMRW